MSSPDRRRVTEAPAVPCACHAPLPPLPRRLREVVKKRGQTSSAEPLSVDARGRLLERAELRARRIALSERHASEDWAGVASELALVLPASHPKVAARWRELIARHIKDARRALDHLCQIEAMILAHDPDTDAWLRRQLAGLRHEHTKGEGRG